MTESLNLLTLADQFFRDQGASGASGELSTVLNRVTLAGRMINDTLIRAGLRGQLGKTGTVNVQGEEVKQLDEISNAIFCDVFDRTPVVAAMASEEIEHVHYYPADVRTGKYVLVHDPLDGSGNVDINGSMGTIFGVFRREDPEQDASESDFFRMGRDLVAAGYLLYGPSTVFVYTVGGPVHGFTLDRAIGAFFLTHPNLTFPTSGGSYAVNEANARKWHEPVRDLVRAFRDGETACGKRSARYVGALVADFHRTLIQGGIYMYPGQTDKPDGKLRLLFECAPLAFVARQAGGAATDGTRDILDIRASKLHQRTPLFIGAKGDVDEVRRRLAPR